MLGFDGNKVIKTAYPNNILKWMKLQIEREYYMQVKLVDFELTKVSP